MQRFVATLHNALSVRKRPLSRNPESSYKDSNKGYNKSYHALFKQENDQGVTSVEKCFA